MRHRLETSAGEGDAALRSVLSGRFLGRAARL